MTARSRRPRSQPTDAGIFVDTNILIHAHDLDAGDKHLVAAERIRDLWTSRRGVLSTQVLQEFYVNVTRKIPRPLSKDKARTVVEAYAVWQVESIEAPDILRASALEERFKVSFWDALILAAARKAGAGTVLSEDFNPGQEYEGVRIENPFR